MIGARVYDTADSTNFDFALARLNANGSFDTSFDGDGKVIVDFGNIHSDLFAIKIQTDGKIVAAGTAENINSTDFAVARLNTNGSLDTGFSGDGKQTTDIGTNSFELLTTWQFNRTAKSLLPELPIPTTSSSILRL